MEDRFWERSVEWSSHAYRRKIYQKELSIGESYRRTAGLGLITRDWRDEETLVGSLVLALSSPRYHVEGSLLALNMNKKTAALGSGSKLPLHPGLFIDSPYWRRRWDSISLKRQGDPCWLNRARSLSSPRYYVEGSLLALNMNKKTAVLGSGSKLPIHPGFS